LLKAPSSAARPGSLLSHSVERYPFNPALPARLRSFKDPRAPKLRAPVFSPPDLPQRYHPSPREPGILQSTTTYSCYLSCHHHGTADLAHTHTHTYTHTKRDTQPPSTTTISPTSWNRERLEPFAIKVSSQTLFGERQIPTRARSFGAHDTGGLLGKVQRDTVIVDIASLLKSSDSNESSASPTYHTPTTSVPSSAAVAASRGGPPAASYAVAPPAVPSPRAGPVGGHPPPPLGGFSGPTATSLSQIAATGSGPGSRPGSGSSGKRSMPPHTSESPAKKQSKWSPEEDALIIELRGSGMKWDDISKRLPGRSSISCRLHYQNYLERRSEWDEERKNKLARLYER
jgi:hypothetical protein